MDPVALSEWLAGLEPSTSRDRAVARFATLLAVSDPRGARAWAESISDAGDRERLMQDLPAGVAP